MWKSTLIHFLKAKKREEAQAILYHDGQYIAENRFIAHKECPLTLLLTFADTWTAAVYEEGREIEENKNYFRRE
jgi:hypothetical protein